MMMILLFPLFLSLLTIGHGEATGATDDSEHVHDCRAKKFAGQDSFVCVCNHRHCDTLGKLQHIGGDEIISFESDRDKYRFHKSVLQSQNHDQHPVDGSDAVITIERERRDQRILGFGGAFTDATGFNVRKLDEKMQKRFVRDYFGEKGLEYTMGRVHIGGCDFSYRNYTLDDHPNDFELKHFNLTHEDLDYKIHFIEQAQKFYPNIKLFASLWSPPAWMKTNGKLNHLGILKGEPGEFYYKLYVKYIIKFLDAYKSKGIKFWGLTTGNEPSAGLKPKYAFNALGLSPDMMREFVKLDLGPGLKKAGYGRDKLKLMMLDDNTNMLEYYAGTVLDGGLAEKYIDGIAIHWYLNRKFGYDSIQRTRDRYPKKFMLSTEACEGAFYDSPKVALGNWTRAETYATDIIEDLNRGVVGWVDWNMALDLQGGPNWVKNFVDSPIIVDKTQNEYYRQPMFYALAHFTKFLPPESIRIEHKMHAKHSGIRATVFKSPRNTFVIIILNSRDHHSKVTIKGFRHQSMTIEMKPHSIRTLITKFNPKIDAKR
ncbi:lysosomal acid glucosylceramidase-like [Brevipalpus obovatus]|uniref:lysosomal acid glucosylceramidase-like n=1 Tax=Brevipalpus obovatus TaxID=246614 RepID=UPI003D9E0BBB